MRTIELTMSHRKIARCRIPFGLYFTVGLAACCFLPLGCKPGDPAQMQQSRALHAAERPEATTNAEALSSATPSAETPRVSLVPANAQRPRPAKFSIAEVMDPAAIEARLADNARFLSADEQEGRGVGTQGLERCADYIARQFTDAGLSTDSYDGTPFQKFLISPRLGLGSTNGVTLRGPEGKHLGLAVGRDFTPLSLSSSGEFNLALAFVGYGITDKAVGYDDYAGMNVRGKAVVMLRHEPQQGNADSVFNGTQPSEHSYFDAKITNALEHGALAVIFCTDDFSIESATSSTRAARESAKEQLAEENERFQRLAEPTAKQESRHRQKLAQLTEAIDGYDKSLKKEPDPLLSFNIGGKVGERMIPVLHARRAAIEPVIRQALGMDLAAVEQGIDADLTPHSSDLSGWRAKGEVSVARKGTELKNVIGILNGKGPLSEETIVVGAHYDHLGWGGWGSLSFDPEKKIHNGADDNASGTTVLIEIARRLAARPEPLPRRVEFITFTAEEMGLIGSEHYVDDPLIPLDQCIAMLNLDMVGRLRADRLTIYGTGTATEFNPLVDRLAEKHGFQLAKHPGGYGPSDHASFYAHGLPVLHLFTGFHADYHRPSDDFEKLNIPGMRRVVEFMSDAIVELAEAPSRPEAKKSGPSVASFNLDIASLLPFPTNRSRNSAAAGGVTLGVAPGKRSSEKGCPLDEVARQGPAERAGLRARDVITQFDDRSIKDASDLAQAIKGHKPGDRVTVIALRDGIELEFDVTLGGGP